VGGDSYNCWIGCLLCWFYIGFIILELLFVGLYMFTGLNGCWVLCYYYIGGLLLVLICFMLLLFVTVDILVRVVVGYRISTGYTCGNIPDSVTLLRCLLYCFVCGCYLCWCWSMCYHASCIFCCGLLDWLVISILVAPM